MIKLDKFAEDISRALYSLLYFIEQEHDDARNIAVDVPVCLQFTDGFDEFCFRNAVASFLAHHGIALKYDFFDTGLPLRQLAKRLEYSERVAESDFVELLDSIAAFALRNEEARYLAMEKDQSVSPFFVH